MNFMKSIKNSLVKSRFHLKDNSVESIIWLVNLVPSKVGFSILKEKISFLFWITHLSLLLYIYGVGSFVYQVRFAKSIGDYIKSYVNITIIILTANITYWFMMKRSLFTAVLKQVILNDQLAKESESLREKHKKLLSLIKKILFIFYGFNYMDAIFIYWPHRADIANDHFAMTPCVGLEPLTKTPNHEICLAIVMTQEFTLTTVVLNYQALLLFLIAHTAAMFQMLAAEMLELDHYEDSEEGRNLVKQRLPILIQRHCMILNVKDKLKWLYSVPMGVNFGTNAICICLFFYLSVQEWISFSPVLIYCFLVFFLYCYLCQRLINASEVFEKAVYSCGWEKFGLKEQKTIYVMLMQAQRPVMILAADITPVNIYTFASTMKAMFQFITVVKL